MDGFLKDWTLGWYWGAVVATPWAEVAVGCLLGEGVASEQVAELVADGDTISHRMYLSSGGMSSSLYSRIRPVCGQIKYSKSPSRFGGRLFLLMRTLIDTEW